MIQFVYLKNTPQFTIKSYKGKSWTFWNATEKKMLKSETYVKDYKAQYQFELVTGDIISLSKDQVGQMLVCALEAGKPLSGLSFEAKTNGKTGLDTRWFINPLKAPTTTQNTQNKQSGVNSIKTQPGADLSPTDTLGDEETLPF